MLLLLLACAGPAPVEPTWYQDVLPIVERSCLGCHAQGGIAALPLEDFDAVQPIRGSLAAAVATGSMPPWPPDPGCNTYEADRRLSDGERATLLAWAEGEGAEGDPAAAVHAEEPAPGLTRVDLELAMPEPYTPRIEPDDYRCFLVEWTAGDGYVTGFRALPGEEAVVHHVIAYAIPPEEAETYRALDAAEEGPGYTCFGGPGGEAVSEVEWIGGWAPGGTGTTYPAGTGIHVAEGSLIALQLHYNTTAAGPLPDQSSLQVSLEAEVEAPARIVKLADPAWVYGEGMDIPAGQDDVVHSFETPELAAGTDGLVWGAGLHLHQLGRRGRIDLRRADGDDACLLDIPDWDFHWQGVYQLAEAEPIGEGDQLYLECAWDNGAGTTDVAWGEGTGDEMCLGLLYVTPRLD